MKNITFIDMIRAFERCLDAYEALTECDFWDEDKRRELYADFEEKDAALSYMMHYYPFTRCDENDKAENDAIGMLYEMYYKMVNNNIWEYMV